MDQEDRDKLMDKSFRIGVVESRMHAQDEHGQETSGKVFRTSRSTNGGLLQNEPGALFYSAPFYFSCGFAILRPELIEVSHDSSIACAIACAPLKPCCAKRSTGETAPDSSAFASDKPFCPDTGAAGVAAVGPDPRMHQLLESGQPLPQNLPPYYEMALDQPTRSANPCWRNLLLTRCAGEQA